jgi:hypothetical protein
MQDGDLCYGLQGIYAPSKIDNGARIYYENSISATSAAMFDNYRSVLDSYSAAVAAGALPNLDAKSLRSQSDLLKKYSSDVKALAGTKIQTGEGWDHISSFTGVLLWRGTP